MQITSGSSSGSPYVSLERGGQVKGMYGYEEVGIRGWVDVRRWAGREGGRGAG